MSKAKNTTPNTEATPTEVVTENPILPVAKQGELTINQDVRSLVTVMNVTDFLAMKAEAQKLTGQEVGVCITATYREFRKDESIVGIFVGAGMITPKRDTPEIDELTGEIVAPAGSLQTVHTVQWMESDGKLYQNGGVALFGEFFDKQTHQPKIPFGSKVRITCEGKNNRTLVYSVELL